MRNRNWSRAKILFIAATRAMLGAGVGLLTAARLRARKRRRVGLTLLTVGALTTLPAAYFLYKMSSPEEERAAVS